MEPIILPNINPKYTPLAPIPKMNVNMYAINNTNINFLKTVKLRI